MQFSRKCKFKSREIIFVTEHNHSYRHIDVQIHLFTNQNNQCFFLYIEEKRVLIHNIKCNRERERGREREQPTNGNKTKRS